MGLFQTFTDADYGEVIFIDHKQSHHSSMCQPRDIEIVTPVALDPKDRDHLREEIAVCVRRNQGDDRIDIRRNLKWS